MPCMEEGDRPWSSRPEAGGRPAVCLPRRIQGPSPGGRGRSEHESASSGPGHHPGGPQGAGAHAARVSGLCVHSQARVSTHGCAQVHARIWGHLGLHTRSTHTHTHVWDSGSECALRGVSTRLALSPGGAPGPAPGWWHTRGCPRARPPPLRGSTSRLTHVEGLPCCPGVTPSKPPSAQVPPQQPDPRWCRR